MEIREVCSIVAVQCAALNDRDDTFTSLRGAQRRGNLWKDPRDMKWPGRRKGVRNEKAVCAVYMLTNKPDGALYTGVTSDLPKRIWQHKNKTTKGFSTRYNLTRLVYFELSEDMYQAITRKKQIKAGSRESNIMLIEKANPDWRDLYPEIVNPVVA